MRPCDRVIAAQAEARVKVRVKVRVRLRVRLRVRVRVRVRVRARRLQAGSNYNLDRGIREGGVVVTGQEASGGIWAIVLKLELVEGAVLLHHR